MLNEDKIKLMTSISMFEKKEGKYISPVKRYFKSDYISRYVLRSFLGYTFCSVLVFLLIFLYHAEDIFSMLNLDVLKEHAWGYGAAYAVGLFFYLLITIAVYARRYECGVKGMKVYVAKLKRLEKRYEFQNRTKELSREVRKHDSNLSV